MPKDTKTYFVRHEEATMHQFKTHLSYYVRMMEKGLYKAVIVKRGKKPVGVFMLYSQDKGT